MKWCRLWSLILCLCAVLAVSACTSAPSAKENRQIMVRVVVTENFGQKLIFDKLLEVSSGSSAMETLRKVAEVKTEYGGGFVDAINGIRSGFSGGTTRDWFVYINGILANTGVLDYTLHNGDVQHWDIHDWGFRQFIPAIVGGFPEPFLHGYSGRISRTVIAFDKGFEEEAENLKQVLVRMGTGNVSAKTITQLTQSDKETCNLILLGTLDAVILAELNQIWKKLGFFAFFRNGKLVVLNLEGKETVEHGAETGLIQATQSPWNPKGIGACENVVWMVSGTDSAGVRNALDIMMNRAIDWQYACAAVITSRGVIRVP